MRIADLSPATLAAIKKMRYDYIVEKHEGPETWDWLLNSQDPEVIARNERDKSMGAAWEPPSDAEFMDIGGHAVLLPVSAEHHSNITILHHFLSQDEIQMVVYLKDTTYGEDAFDAGFVAICNRFPGEVFYVAAFYHEWFIIDYDPLADRWKK
ncbi:MAG: hypothetical protein DYG98_16855 [Haliscomenobacteraceae bacterium CHB4]|nr:hypothetical protein [Haliscomenobacteraceae bacterium CHB4]